MKVFSSQQMREIESKAYQEGASEEAFMEQAGKGIAQAAEDFLQIHQLPRRILLLCAKGNNSGDAYVAGRYLLKEGCQVQALQSVPVESCSPLCIKNHQRFLDAGGKTTPQLKEFPKEGIILDGLFGTGFKGILQEPFASIVRAANESGLPILAIDIPSGLNGDTGQAQGKVIIARETLFLGAPKTGFFLNEGWNFVGKLRGVDFGLPQKFIDDAPSNMSMLSDATAHSLLPPIKRTWQKYSRGYVTGLAGSPDMPGAAILASWAAMSSGAGYMRLIHPEGMQAQLSAAPLELVRQTYKLSQLEPVMESMNKATASFIGPGIGRTVEALTVLKYVLENLTKPCVIDADALTLLSEHEMRLPQQTILTPHQGEMLRLLKNSRPPTSTEELLKLAQAFADERKVTLVLKGAPTFILQTGLPIYVNPRGDPGMATAGTGDVLTGIIASLLAQHLPPHEAALLGVHLHSIAGEFAAQEKTSRCVIASDLIKHLPDAFRSL
jgi:ADP-dependent NAD(P)H-hydrate dehydratase / NAD(P)H-hydrate epimerase